MATNKSQIHQYKNEFMHKRYCFLLILLFSITVNSQNSIKGIVKRQDNNPLSGATIILRSLQDTINYTGCMSDKTGVFEIKDMLSGNYKLEVSYVGYTTYAKEINLTKSTNLGVIQLDENIQALDDITVQGERKIEKSDKTILIPTSLEKKHSANSFELLNIMQIPELDILPQINKITTQSGSEIVICINGMEVLSEDIATLRSENIQSIEYIRNPEGKYAGKGGVINFITVQLDFGGNVYLSAGQGFVYKYGDYIAFTDFTKNKMTISLTASGDWSRDHSYSEGNEFFTFDDKSVLSRNFSGFSSFRRTNNQAGKFKLTSTGKNYRFNTHIILNSQSVPNMRMKDHIEYWGKYNNEAQREIFSESKNFIPTIYANYTLWLPSDQTLDLTGTASYSNNRYLGKYNETGHKLIESQVNEKIYSTKGRIQYYKTTKNKFALSASLANDYSRFKDVYAGTSSGYQSLTTILSSAQLQLSRSKKNYYYYVSGGFSNSAVSLNDKHYNYNNPLFFYGINYTFNQKHALSLNGFYTHTLFNPSNKNSMIIPISFFESIKGNPEITPLNVLSNTLSYNGQFGSFMINASYNNYIYFDNIVHSFFADNNIIFNTSVNDGTFYGNMFTATIAYNAFENRFRLSASAIEEYNMMRGNQYNLSRNIIRLRLSATYLLGDWMMKLNYHTPYTTLDIREPYMIHRSPLYEIQLRWNHNSWSIETFVRNPFNRYDRNHITMDYGCYNKSIFNFNENNGFNINLKVIYSFGYGKKSERSDISIERTNQSAILRSY
ncbi:MAG: TonB-dependent receptor [Bacteroidales bacterium]